MHRGAARLLHPGVRPSQVQRRAPAVVLLLLFLVPIVQPVTTAEIASDDFGILDALDELLEDRTLSSSDLLAEGIASTTLASVDAAAREVREGDAIVEAERFLDGLEVRDSAPFEPDHPRAYEFLLDAENHSGAGLPDNLFQTLFSVENWELTDPLAIGINTYAIYLNFSSKNDGPSYESWTSGTFTGDIQVGANLNLFDNYIDIDGDGAEDVIVELTVQGLLQRGQGWDITTSGGVGPIAGLIPETLWIRPIFQWRVHQIDAADPLWDDMAFLEVSLLKGFAFDFTVQNSESYSIVIDTRFTQPPNEFRVGVGLDRITFEISDTVTDVAGLLLDLLGGGVGADTLSLTSISAPYAITIQNPDAPGGSLQTECADEDWFDPETQPRVDSHADRCSFGVGIGFVHFDAVTEEGTVPDVLELAYIDAGFHPADTGRRLPSEIDLTLRNDNFGDNSFDTVEIFTDRDSDVYVHYFEDRSEMPEGEANFGNISDARIWIRGLPSGSLPEEEINALFTMIGEAPGSVNLPGDMPNRLSLFIGIKNFSGDATTNVNDPTLPINPATPPNTLIVIAAMDFIPLLEFASSFQRGGFAPDRSSMSLVVENLPPVIVVSGSFSLGQSGVDRLRPDNSNLNAISQVLDNALLGLVEIILDLGTIVNSIPGAIVGTAGSAGGTVEVACFTQVKAAWSTGETRSPAEVGTLGFALSSSDQPWIPNEDHLLLSSDASIEVVQGRSGPVEPLVPVAMSARVSGISGVTQSFDPLTSERVLALKGSSSEPLIVGHVSHDGPNMTLAQKQAAMISNRPDDLRLVQLPERLIYEASAPIGTITYGGQDGEQRNALRLVGLPSEFELVLGSEVGYVATTPIQAVEIQSSNGTVPLTMDGDHVRFSVDGDETSLSVRISDVLRMRRLSPLEEGAAGPEGNSRVEMQRTSSEPLRLLFEDATNYDDPLLGLNGRAVIEPLPADIMIAVPGGADSEGLELPDFGDQEGVEGLSFFLGDLVAFGQVANDFIHALTKDLGGSVSGESDLAIGMDLDTGESFNMTADMRKGTTPNEPAWVHGLSMEADERVDVDLNLSRLDRLTLSGRITLETIWEDARLTADEQEQGALVLESAGFLGAKDLMDVLTDGRLSEDEKQAYDLDNWSAQGIDLTERRAWHVRTWLPSLPAGAIDLDYDFRFLDGVPTYQFDLAFTQWQPEYEDMTILVKGISGQDVDLRLTGFDTENPRDVVLDAVFFQERNLTVPRLTLDMRYDVGVRLESAHAVFIDHTTQTRSEALILDVPRSTDVSATIGDVLRLDVTVPEEFQTDGGSAEALMIQQHRFVDGRWWPATVFMRDLPGELHLTAEPSEVFDIRQETSFQGLFTMDYASNGETMDLFVQAYGRAIDSKGDITMIAEDLPSRFQLKTTDRFGVEIASSGSGVRQLYLRASDVPSSPGLTLSSMEVVGEDLKGATIHMYRVGGVYPVIVLDGITTGRVIATANADLTPADREPRLESVPLLSDMSIDGRGVLLDTQFTGILPTASSVGVNGMASDLSLIGSLTGGAVETRHVLVVEPISSAVASGLAWVV
ncbi:MAG TPA: hypothetical protein HA276_06120 [Candidatus Poseidoniaceae archaeon]|nr:MAG: hypothetical protein CBD01_000650 [Euryarchaeota archaeon TMED141]DAC16291.1 MAG TPA: hypothetical protein D7I01_06000 [Candidatus Poseidoniales archaeon]HII97249.1 hypothetical protein [Candidatus Poseidoniaceae archaeon]